MSENTEQNNRQTAKIETIGKKWIHPGTGEVRYYINKAYTYGGLDVEFYKSGNVSDAYLNGESISNRRARSLMASVDKVWMTEDGKIHAIGYSTEHDFFKAVCEGIHKALEDENKHEER